MLTVNGVPGGSVPDQNVTEDGSTLMLQGSALTGNIAKTLDSKAIVSNRAIKRFFIFSLLLVHFIDCKNPHLSIPELSSISTLFFGKIFSL